MASVNGNRNPGKYQLLAPLRPEEYQALKHDIAEHGVLVPVEVDRDSGEILDGHHRSEIAEELGVRYRTIKRHFSSEKARLEHVVKINVLRRHLGPISWARAFEKLCKIRGVKLQQGSRNDRNGTCLTVRQVAEELGVSKQTAHRRLRLAQQLRGHRDLIAAVDSGAMEATTAQREARTRNARKKAKRETHRRLPRSVRIAHCDFRDLRVRSSTADLIVVDPPYAKKYVPLWTDLSEFAARVLKPGRLLVTYCGQFYLPEVLGRLRHRLEYVWAGSVRLTGRDHLNFKGRKVRVRSKILLFLSNGPYEPRRWFDDSIIGGGTEKDAHPWQQAESEARQLIEQLTEPGELVIDPCLGAGTTGVAARKLGRRFVGCDVDEDAVTTARRRLAEERQRQ